MKIKDPLDLSPQEIARYKKEVIDILTKRCRVSKKSATATANRLESSIHETQRQFDTTKPQITFEYVEALETLVISVESLVEQFPKFKKDLNVVGLVENVLDSRVRPNLERVRKFNTKFKRKV